MVVNERLINQVRSCLQDCGYEISKPRGKNSAFHIQLGGEDIGYMDKAGAYHLMEDYAHERERLTSVLNFANDFRYYPDRIDGQLKVAAFNNMALTAQLNPGQGIPEFHISELDEAGHIAFQSGTFQDFEEAKFAFAKQSRLYDPDFAVRQQERAVVDKFRQIAQAEHYHFKEVDQPKVKWEITSKDHKPVGYISQDNQFVAAGKSEKQRNHINSLYAQAKWEVSKEQNGQSYLLQKLTDALTKLGFTIKHAWQRLTMTATVTDHQTPVGAISANGEPSYTPQATPQWKKEIDTAIKQAKEEIRTEYEHFTSKQTITDHSEESQSSFTQEEMLFIKALMASPVCKELVQKNGLQDVVTSLNDKMKEQFPALPEYSNPQNSTLTPVRPVDFEADMQEEQ